MIELTAGTAYLNLRRPIYRPTAAYGRGPTWSLIAAGGGADLAFASLGPRACKAPRTLT